MLGDIGSSQSLNRYAYCNGNPVSLIDPFGLCSKEDGYNHDAINTILDAVQYGLDLAGLMPGFGEPVDLLNAGIYYSRGDNLNAGLSAGATIPFAGWAGTGGKFINKGARYIDDAEDAVKASRGVATPAHSVNAKDSLKYLETGVEVDDLTQQAILKVVAMEEGPEFEMDEKELRVFAMDLMNKEY
ncbi:MAG: hypothetical protein HY779_04920 [Rubrobacteridae bacterium]|nr:hypothetical protein [Rubrobacteridae bacterium]